jgi:hypothetical protein
MTAQSLESLGILGAAPQAENPGPRDNNAGQRSQVFWSVVNGITIL